MKSRKNFKKGFMGLLSLLLAMVIIILFMLQMNKLTKKETGNNIIQERKEIINSANEAKNMIENSHQNLR